MKPRTPEPPTFIDALVREKRIIVCCGAGGVGKTTTSAAIGLAGAMAGRKVLVLTIDPARRLAEAMGIPPASHGPVSVPRDKLDACGVPKEGELDAWMLSPQIIFENMVDRLTPNEESRTRILSNRLYKQLSELISGMQEYTAAEALYTLSIEGTYDLVVLDTPPSRNALEFLEAPRKLAFFLDDKVISVFMPSGGKGRLWRGASTLISSVFTRVFGEGFFADLQDFLGAFSGMFGSLRKHAAGVRELLTSSDSAFLLVTSPDPSALLEARFFQGKIRELTLPFAGYVLNRSWAYTRGLGSPEDVTLPEDATDDDRSALVKFSALANEERRRAKLDRDLLGRLRTEAAAGSAVATPHLGGAVEDLAGLAQLARSLTVPGTEIDKHSI